jgi:hypothetical protein
LSSTLSFDPELGSAFDVDPLAGVLPGTTAQADPWQPSVAGSTGAALGTGTGQHGIEPIGADLGGGMGTAIVTVKDWLTEPITTPMDPATIFLLVGIIIVAVIAWNMILFHIRIAAEAI